MDTAKSVKILSDRVKALDVPLIIKEAEDFFGTGKIALASSFGAEDQVLTHVIRMNFPGVDIFTIDTGRLPQETYDVMQATMEKYSFRYSVILPDADKLKKFVETYGPNMFYSSADLRKKCCRIRKVLPLKKKLSGLKAWMCGLRREQSVTRSDVDIVEWDSENSIVKINPLALWKEKDVWDYIKEKDVPYNKLHLKGYASIGCSPCTRAVGPGEDIRSGRWWWEAPEHKECGLHRREKKD
jgi:phosphoadenosine phosphosulfate reductase